jgi:predicted Zn-ribbon and HTH transcriptional regulator
MVDVKVNVLVCKKCGHKWINRKIDVRQCPKCKSAYWDKPKHEAKTKGK